MVPGILGLAVIVIVTYHVFKTARENGRNAALWAVAAVGIGFFFQWVMPIVVGIIIAVILIATGTPANGVQEKLGWWAFFINVFFVGLSFVALFMLLKFVSRIPDEIEVAPPPPPPTFDGNFGN